MTWFSTMVHQGGATMLWILYLVGPALIVAILHAAMARRWSLWASLGMIALVLAIGIYGRHVGRSMTETEAMDRDRTADRDSMLDAGYREASLPLKLAGLVAGVLAVPVIIGELRRRRRK